jgi:hypothetical protein
MSVTARVREHFSVGISLVATVICFILLGVHALSEFVNAFLVNLSGRAFGDYEAEIGVLDSVFHFFLLMLGVASGRSVVRIANHRTTGRSRLRTFGRFCVALNVLLGLTAISLVLWRVLPQYLESRATP